MENKNSGIKKRLISFGLLSTIIFLALGARLYYIQIYKSPAFSEQALKQRGKEVALYPKRGIIFDRNLVPLTNNVHTQNIILPKSLLRENKAVQDLIIKYTSLSYKEIVQMVNSDDYLLQIPLKENISITNQPLNVFLVDIIERYSEDNLLSHVIGYTSNADNSGESGLEKVYDEFLKIGDKKSLLVEYDRNRSLILGGTEYVNEITDPNNPAGVKLTIDYQIQKSVEDIMDEKRVNGAAIVTEISTGKILSLVSRPNYNQDSIEEDLWGPNMALYNKAIQVGYPPGSIFKIIVLIAALEDNPNITREQFHCKGYEEINNVRINCTKEHGELTLKQAFEQSCNSAFIQLGKQVGSKKIINLAKELNFGEKINIGLLEEIGGNLPEGNDLLGPAIGNISIGQGKIEVTPLQIANLINTIANNGIQKHLTIIEGITNKDGKVLKPYNKEDDIRVVSTRTSEIVLEYLESVVIKGTGRNLEMSSIGGAGGKTGSAEAILNKKGTIHGWFTGYFPENNPKYSITVLVEEGNSGSKSAAPIFEKIAKEINNIYP